MTDDLIARLRALSRHEHSDYSIGDEAADALEAAGWQPIETAPKDGSSVLASDTSGLTRCCVAYWLAGDEWSGWVYEDDLLLDNNPLGPRPSHWMPLPAPPKEARNG